MKSLKESMNESLNESATFLKPKEFNKIKSQKDQLKYLNDFYNGEIMGEDFYPGQGKDSEIANDTLNKLIEDGYLEDDGDDDFVYVLTQKGEKLIK